MSIQAKNKVIVLGGVVLILLVLIALSLTSLSLKPGEPLLLEGAPGITGGAANLGGGGIFLLLLRGFLALMLILLPVHILISLLTPEGRKRLFAELFIVAIFILAALWLSEYAKQNLQEQAQQEEQLSEVFGQELPSADLTEQEIPSFEPETQNWLVTLTVVITSLALAAFLFAISRRVLRRKTPSNEMEQLADQAQQAVKSIGLGLNFENIILQCYVEMSQTIAQSRGIQRGSTMTPLEFQQHLEKAGVPVEPVSKLTHLFETVRYGHLQVGDQGKREAVESLNQIIAYCRSLG